MAVLAERMCGRKREAPGLGAQTPAQGRRYATLSAGFAVVGLLAAYAGPAAAQQTAIDGGPAVEDPGPAEGQPDTGQLLTTRPGRPLLPPRRAPRRLLVATPAATTPIQDPELASRLLVPLVTQSAQPMTPNAAAPPVEAPMAIGKSTAPPPGPPPAPPLAPPPAPVTLEPWVAAQPEPILPESAVPEPARATVAPPAPSTLAEELIQSPATAEPSQNSVAAAKSAPPPPPAESLTSKPAVEPQTAALPPAPALTEQIRVLFPEGSIELRDDARRKLSAVATALQENTTIRVQLLAYANANTNGASRARRLSLSRALAVRAYLIEREVRSTRMDVRALGDKIGDGPADRVDILPQVAN
jgi:outer membrane protein OmpA-like peptidoglycan-associated protein